MHMNLLDLKQQHKAVLDKAAALLGANDHVMTQSELESYTALMGEARGLGEVIRSRESGSTIRSAFGNNPVALLDAGTPNPGSLRNRNQKPMSAEYTESFLAFVRSGGKQATSALSEGFDPLFGGFALPALPRMGAALYEGGAGAGGYAVSVPTDNQLVPLAIPDLGVRTVARVMPTSTDVKIPQQATFGTAAIKTESGASTNTFAESDPALSQFTLTAWMVGLTHTISWELLQDVAMFQEFGVQDLLTAVDILEDNLFLTGNGTSQPQALIGNTGTGTGSAYTVDSAGDYLLQSTIDVIGTLKASYFPNAGFLMARSTAAAIRKAQMQSNLYAPVFTREGGRDFLNGFPVTYSQNMPALPTATTAGVVPILFGSFADGYIIGDRGGSGTFVKILDQPLATAGQTILLGYKRVDGRVRRSEAIQAITVAHS